MQGFRTSANSQIRFMGARLTLYNTDWEELRKRKLKELYLRKLNFTVSCSLDIQTKFSIEFKVVLCMFHDTQNYMLVFMLYAHAIREFIKIRPAEFNAK